MCMVSEAKSSFVRGAWGRRRGQSLAFYLQWKELKTQVPPQFVLLLLSVFNISGDKLLLFGARTVDAIQVLSPQGRCNLCCFTRIKYK